MPAPTKNAAHISHPEGVAMRCIYQLPLIVFSLILYVVVVVQAITLKLHVDAPFRTGFNLTQCIGTFARYDAYTPA
jgi:hypothetical protein